MFLYFFKFLYWYLDLIFILISITIKQDIVKKQIKGVNTTMLPKIKKINLSTQLIDTMTTLIESGEWDLGSKLSNEVELAASFNVSRNIMRESMKILENFGILESKAGIGTFVSETALSSIHNMRFFNNLKNNSSVETILEARLIIEPELAYYAALRSTEEDLILLKEIFERNEEIHKENQFTKKDDFNFHMYIAKCSKNIILENLLFSMLDQLRASDYVDFDLHAENDVIKNSYANHREIAMAIIERDPLQARKLMFQHLFVRINVINSSYNKDLLYSQDIQKKRLAEKAEQNN